MPQRTALRGGRRHRSWRAGLQRPAEPEKPAPRFAPGQFLHLALDDYHPSDFWPESRVFSIASSPTERETLRITYAVKGVFTTRMEAELAPGRQVWVKLPYGEFCVEGQRRLSSGRRHGHHRLHGLPRRPSGGAGRRIDLFYGARQPGLLIYRSVVERRSLAARVCMRTILQNRMPTGQAALPGASNGGRSGVSIRAPRAMTYYLSGPPPC